MGMLYLLMLKKYAHVNTSAGLNFVDSGFTTRALRIHGYRRYIFLPCGYICRKILQGNLHEQEGHGESSFLVYCKFE